MGETDPKILTDVIWSYWKDLGIVKPAMTWIELFQVVKFFLKETEKREIDPAAVDIKMEIDARVGFRENKRHVDEILTLIAPPIRDPDELLRQELDRLAKDTEFHILTEKEMVKLSRYEGKAERLAKRVDELEAKREKERGEAAESIERLERELAAAPTLKLKILRDFKEGIVEFKADQVIDTKNRGWALTKIQQGLAEEVMPGVPVTPPPAVLSPEDRMRLEDEFRASLMGDLGRIPRDVMSEFRVEFEKVKTKPYAEALNDILGLAREIAWRLVKKPKPPVVKPPPIEVAMPPELVTPPPVPLPKKPISDLPFPRSPSSEEKAILLDAFKSLLAEVGIDHYRFMPTFKERVLNWTFRYWGEVLKHFSELVSDIKAGREVKFIPIPPMPWKEERKREDAIVHFTATKLYPTIDELIDHLGQWGVHTVTPEEVKAAVKKAWKEKNIWFTSVSKEFLEELIAEPVG